MLPARPKTTAKLLRGFGAFLLNFTIAALLTNILRSDFRLRRDVSAVQFVMKDGLLEAAIAFALGYFVYRRWRSESAKWVWVAGFLLFLLTAIHFWVEQHAPLSAVHGSVSVYWEMSGIGCLSDRARCTDFASTLMFLRTAFYSGGAWFCLWFRRHEAAALPNLRKAMLSLRRP